MGFSSKEKLQYSFVSCSTAKKSEGKLFQFKRNICFVLMCFGKNDKVVFLFRENLLLSYLSFFFQRFFKKLKNRKIYYLFFSEKFFV